MLMAASGRWRAIGSSASDNIRKSSSYHNMDGISWAEVPVAKNKQETSNSCSMGTISVRVFRRASSQVSNIDRGGSDNSPFGDSLSECSFSNQWRKSSGGITWYRFFRSCNWERSESACTRWPSKVAFLILYPAG